MDPVYGDSLCRFCLCSSDSLIDLFEENGQRGFTIEEAIEDLLRYKITKTDGYPPYICTVCFGKLNNFRLFKCQCNNSKIEYANRFFRKGGYMTNQMHTIPTNYMCIKQEPDEGAAEDFVPCEVSIKTENDDGEMSASSLVFKDTREMSDDNYSEADDVEEVGEMQIEPDIPTDPSFYNERSSMDAVGGRSEVPQKRKSWDKVSMIRAVEAVINKEMSLLKASKAFNVPRSTIKDYVKKNGKNSVDASIGRKPVLPAEVEEELVHYCLELERVYFGLTPRDVERMAYHLATRNGLKHPFSDEKQAAGRKWVKQFFRRHPNLTYRKPQTLTAARIAGFTRQNVERFFSVLEPELVRINFSPERLFCMDETAYAIIQEENRGIKVLGLKGKGQVESLSAQERSTLVTLLTCMSASGQFVPPMVILPTSGDEDSSLIKSLPPGAILCADQSSWVEPETFVKWLRHFVTVVKPTQYDYVVLVLDAHYSHNRNIDVIEFARSNGVCLVCLPPHSSHKMNPVEVSFGAEFKVTYCREAERLRRSASNDLVVLGGVQIPLTIRDVPELIGRAYGQAATVEVAAKGFWKTGISPFQRNAFGDHDFATNSRDVDLVGGDQGHANDDDHGMVQHDLQQPGTSGRKHPSVMLTSSPYA